MLSFLASPHFSIIPNISGVLAATKSLSVAIVVSVVVWCNLVFATCAATRPGRELEPLPVRVSLLFCSHKLLPEFLRHSACRQVPCNW